MYATYIFFSLYEWKCIKRFNWCWLIYLLHKTYIYFFYSFLISLHLLWFYFIDSTEFHWHSFVIGSQLIFEFIYCLVSMAISFQFKKKNKKIIKEVERLLFLFIIQCSFIFIFFCSIWFETIQRLQSYYEYVNLLKYQGIS